MKTETRMNRFKILLKDSLSEKEKEKISLGTCDEEVAVNLCTMALGLSEVHRDTLKQLINLCYFSGAKNSLKLLKKSERITTHKIDELIEKCEQNL